MEESKLLIRIIAQRANVSPSQVEGFMQSKNIRQASAMAIADVIQECRSELEKQQDAREWLKKQCHD